MNEFICIYMNVKFSFLAILINYSLRIQGVLFFSSIKPIASFKAQETHLTQKMKIKWGQKINEEIFGACLDAILIHTFLAIKL